MIARDTVSKNPGCTKIIYRKINWILKQIKFKNKKGGKNLQMKSELRHTDQLKYVGFISI